MSLDENRDGAVGEGPDSLVWKEFAKGLTGLWAVTATLLWAGFWGSRAKAKAVAKAKLE